MSQTAIKRTLQFGLFLGIGGLLLYLVFREVKLQGTIDAFHQVHLGLLIWAIILMVFAYVLRAARWRIWEHGLSYFDSFRLILIGFMGNNLLPARLGEIVRAHCTSSRLGQNRGRTAVLASIAAERILDGFVLGVFGVVGATFVRINSQLRLSLFALSFAFGMVVCLLICGICFHDMIRSLLAAANRMFPGHMTGFAQRTVCQFLDGLLPLGRLPRMAAALVVTTAVWGLELGCCYLMGVSTWAGMSLRVALLFVVAVNFASLIPFTIGGIGTIEAVTVTFLISAGVPRYPALAMILLQHAAQYCFTTACGGTCYLAGGFFRIPLKQPKAVVPGRAQGATQVSLIDELRHSLGQLGDSGELRPAPCEEIRLSIVIPAYNEQSRLPRTMLETIRWCTGQGIGFEILIVDDGSRDETLTLARLFEEADVRVHAIACPHGGKGSAVRMGVLNAKGRFILFMDADGATPLNEIPKLLSALEGGYDVAIGSRVMQHPGEVEIKTSRCRRFIGRVFAFFVNLVAIEGIGDTQCGFKMFRRETALAVFPRQKLKGFAFDVEILFIARQLSFALTEIPVNWVAQTGSKVNVVKDSIKMLWDINRIHWLHRDLRHSPSLKSGEIEPISVNNL